ncbi:MAG: MFS transporter [Spirochaetaceae bacterium]|jgi:MFS family permease|nr:MFS transporter [Spirochaetaceae bacterium]
MMIKKLALVYKKDARPLRFLSALVLSGIAYGLYKGVQDNYLIEALGVTPFERGFIEFLREIPGLLVVLILAAMYRLAEQRVFKIGTAVMLAGLVGLLLVRAEKPLVVVCVILFSFGEHIIMPVKSTISLDLAEKGRGGASLGISSTISNLGNIAGYLIVSLVFFLFARAGFERTNLVQFRMIFALASALMLGAVLVSFAMQETSIDIKRRRFYFAKKFYTYYMLEVFYGARKQVFFTFAPMVLIREYGAATSLIATLLALAAVFGMVFSPIVGRLIDKLGYKVIMVGDTLILIVVCFLYGFSHRIFPMHIAFIVVCVNYILDSILTLGSMATNVYVQSISDNQQEITATLSTGISLNHVISIFIALVGGLIWNKAGIELLFSISALLGLINSLYAASIKQSR